MCLYAWLGDSSLLFDEESVFIDAKVTDLFKN